MMDRDELVRRIDDRLVANAPQLGLKRVEEIRRFPGGLSFETYLLEADTEVGSQRFILRKEPEGGPLEPYDIGHEVNIYRHLASTDVPVPEVYYVEDDPSVLGRRFVVCEYIAGTALPHTAPRFNDEVTRQRTLDTFVDMLAAIHSVDVAALRPPDASSVNPVLAEVRHWRSRFSAAELVPRPIVRHLFDVLEASVPTAYPEVLVHGDYRLSNILWEDDRIVGVLDWERAFIGDPMADIAFTMNKALNGWCGIKGEAAERYTARTGIEFDSHRLAFWQLMELAKSAVVGMMGVAALARGRTSDLRLMSVGSASMAIEPAVPRLLAAFEQLSPSGKGAL